MILSTKFSLRETVFVELKGKVTETYISSIKIRIRELNGSVNKTIEYTVQDPEFYGNHFVIPAKKIFRTRKELQELRENYQQKYSPMTISTKFDLGETVFVKYQGEVIKTHITQITVEISDISGYGLNKTDDEYTEYMIQDPEGYNFLIPAKKIFKTWEELLDYYKQKK